MFLSERRRLEIDYYEWLKRESIKQGVAIKDCPMTVIGYLDSEGLLKTEAEKKGEWIPVDERLPSFNDIVLASTDGGDYDELKIILTVYEAEEFWFNGIIKAWMPLPKPYKAESEDKE